MERIVIINESTFTKWMERVKELEKQAQEAGSKQGICGQESDITSDKIFNLRIFYTYE